MAWSIGLDPRRDICLLFLSDGLCVQYLYLWEFKGGIVMWHHGVGN